MLSSRSTGGKRRASFGPSGSRTLRHRKRRLKVQTVFGEAPPGAGVSRTVRHHQLRHELLCWLLFWFCCGRLHVFGQRPNFNGLIVSGTRYMRATQKIQVWHPKSAEHGLQSFWHPLTGVLQTADCAALHDSCSCADEMFITEANHRPVARRPKKLVDTGSWLLGGERRLVHPAAGSLSCISVHESSRRASCVCLGARCILSERTQRV